MKKRRFGTRVAGFVLSLAFAIGCASAPADDETATTGPVPTGVEAAGASASEAQLMAVRDIARELDAATLALDQAAKEQNLDTETSEAWAAARGGVLGSGSLDVSELDSMTGPISEEALFALRGRLDAFEPLLDKLDEREGQLHPAVQEASTRLLEALDTLESIGESQNGVLRRPGLR